jgi:hypothetical protein
MFMYIIHLFQLYCIYNIRFLIIYYKFNLCVRVVRITKATFFPEKLVLIVGIKVSGIQKLIKLYSYV